MKPSKRIFLIQGNWRAVKYSVTVIFIILTPEQIFCQDLKNLIKVDLAIFARLQIKTRYDLNRDTSNIELIVDPNVKGYSAWFNRDYRNPKVFASNEVVDLCNNPKLYSVNLRQKYSAPDSIYYLDSVRKLSSLVHEIAHFIEDTSQYRTLIYNEFILCSDGDTFCMIRMPSEFNAYAAGAFFVLESIQPKLLSLILQTKEDFEQKKIDLINEVYYKLWKNASFRRKLEKKDLLH